MKNILEEVKKTVLEEENIEISDDEAVDKLLYWTETDRKHTALKELQGYVWKEGYDKGDLKGHIYDDVPEALEKWKNSGVKMGVYSSGSVAAQKLIFGSSVFGDLTPYFSHYFDTNVGHKRDKTSYENIQKEIGIREDWILFLSDVEAELDAAEKAGFATMQLLRDGTIPTAKHPKTYSFKQIVF